MEKNKNKRKTDLTSKTLISESLHRSDDGGNKDVENVVLDNRSGINKDCSNYLRSSKKRKNSSKKEDMKDQNQVKSGNVEFDYYVNDINEANVLTTINKSNHVGDHKVEVAQRQTKMSVISKQRKPLEEKDLNKEKTCLSEDNFDTASEFQKEIEIEKKCDIHKKPTIKVKLPFKNSATLKAAPSLKSDSGKKKQVHVLSVVSIKEPKVINKKSISKVECRVFYYKKKADRKKIKKEIFKSNCLKIGNLKAETHFYKNCDLTKSNNIPVDSNFICENCHKFYMNPRNKLRGKFIFKEIDGKRGTVKK